MPHPSFDILIISCEISIMQLLSVELHSKVARKYALFFENANWHINKTAKLFNVKNSALIATLTREAIICKSFYIMK